VAPLSRGRRVPKDLHRYETAALAGLKLEKLAKQLKSRPGLAKWTIKFRLYEPDEAAVRARGFEAVGATMSNK